MNTPHYKDLEVEGSKPGTRRLKWGRWLVLAILTLILLFVALGWLGRKYIAHQALLQWCQDQSLTCEASFDRLGPDGAVISSVRVEAGGAVPFRAEEVVADLKWRGLTPGVSAVSISGPELRGTLDDRGLRFHGLEKLGGSGGSGGGSLPPVKISRGRVALATSAGEIGASVDLEGEFPRSGTLQMTLDPVSLTGLEGTLIWTEGRVDVVASDGQLEGEVFLDLAEKKVPSLVEGGFNWVDVRDVCSSIRAAVEQGRTAQSYLLGGHHHSVVAGVALGGETQGRIAADQRLGAGLDIGHAEGRGGDAQFAAGAQACPCFTLDQRADVV